MSTQPVAVAGEGAKRWRHPAPRLVISVLALAALLIAGVLVHGSAETQNLTIGISGPSSSHLLGTDELGRDVLARLLAGAPTAILGPLAVAAIALMMGLVLGIFAGYRGGWRGATIMRWVDLMYALPPLLVAIVVVGVLGGGYVLAVLVLAVLTAPYDIRLIRGATLAQAQLPYVEAAKVLGASRARIMFRHILPNVLPIALSNAFLNFAFSVVNLAALSFLGLGAPPGSPDWGASLATGRELLFENPWVALAPGIMLVVVAVIANIIGERVGDRIAIGAER